MEAKELRIGNWVYDAAENVCMVTQIGNECLYGFYASVLEGALTRLPHKPIPITEEILLKCGFEGGFLQVTKHTEFHFTNDMLLVMQMFSDSDYSLKHIKYLHQLQNLYFALTYQELKIEL